MNNYKFLLIQLFLVSFALSKEITIGADVVSRYVWRGTDYGNAAAVQRNVFTCFVQSETCFVETLAPALHYASDLTCSVAQQV